MPDVVAGGTISPPVGAAPMPRPWGCLLALLRQAQRCLPASRGTGGVFWTRRVGPSRSGWQFDS